MASLDNPNDDPDQLGGLALAVVPALDDPVEELAAAAQFHDDVHAEGVLVGALDGDDVLVAREVVQDLDLPPHVLHVLLRDELPLGDGLAGVLGAGGELGAEVGGAELALPELAPKGIEVADVGGGVPEDVTAGAGAGGVDAPPHDDSDGGDRGGGGGGLGGVVVVGRGTGRGAGAAVR